MSKNMKKLVVLVLILAMILPLAACGGGSNGGNDAAGNNATAENGTENNAAAKDGDKAGKAGDFHIGIVTGTVSQGEDELRGAEAAIKKYGNADEGGMIKHITYPDNFTQEQETTISKIASLADDPAMKAIIVNQAVPGTVAAFEQIREKNPDIILIANSSQEDTAMIEDAADLVIDVDNVDRGYLIIDAAKKMGAKKFVHVSFPRHLSIELLSLRHDIMKASCEELGLEFYDETAPDPTSDVGIPGAKQFILEKMPAWVEKYGKDTAFFATNDAQTEPLLKMVAQEGAIFVEQDLPSPLMGYPGAFNIDLKNEAGDWPAILKKVEEAVIAAGGANRMGTWAYSFGYTGSIGLVELAKGVVEGKYEVDNLDNILEAFQTYTEGAKWKATLYTDRATGEEKTNHVLVSQDTYVFGKGYLGMDKVEVPEKFHNFGIEK